MFPARKKRLRYARYVRALSQRWQRRLVFLLGGFVVGGAAILLAMAADDVQEAFHKGVVRLPEIAFLLTPAGFALAVFLTVRYFPNAQGSGIPQAIAARRLTDHESRKRLVSLRVAMGKILVTLLGLLCGAATGREGPTAQIGASIMFAVGQTTRSRLPGLILAGSAAGVAAAFNTPLAGIVFGIEEMSRSFEVRTSGLIIGGVIAAGLTPLAFVGNYTYFGTTEAVLHGARNWMAVPVCGVLGGLMGGLFSRILISVARGLPGRIGRWISRHPVGFAALCGLGVAITGYFSNGAVYGTGYSQARALLDGTDAAPWSFGILKFVASTLSAISGIPGGIFSPSLAVGAGFGANIATLFPGVETGAVVVLGMVAYFTGVVQAPITAFVIVTEMTNNHGMLVPLMSASVIAYASSRLVCPVGVYHALADIFVARATPPKEPG